MKAGSEAAFQAQVLNLAELYGWRCYHTHDSRRSQAGFPDLVLVRDAELVFAELKTDKGRLRPEQAEWIKALEFASVHLAKHLDQTIGLDLGPRPAVDVCLWRPADFDELHARLARGRHQLQPTYRAGEVAA